MGFITNNSGIALPLAVWLLHDEYDYVNEPNYISVTTLMKPLRQIILPPRIPQEAQQIDVADFVSRALGHAIHDSIEKAWVRGHERALKLLGYPKDVIERVLINPTDEERRATPDCVPVYIEQRATRKIEVNGEVFTVGGKFDMSADLIVQDNKSTSVNTWIFGGRDEDYQLQMSQYRWIDAGRVEEGHLPRIAEDFGRVNYVFTDWAKNQAKSNPRYPQKRVEEKEIWLLSLEETEEWIRNKIALIQHHRNTPEHLLPECTDEELWRSAPKYKYFSDPAKAADPTARSTKNFDDPAEAHRHMAEKGKGIVVTVPGEVKRCDYCAAFEGCTQKDRYFNAN